MQPNNNDKVKFETDFVRPIHLENFIKACANTRATIIKHEEINYREYILTISIRYGDKELFERISGTLLSEVT